MECSTDDRDALLALPIGRSAVFSMVANPQWVSEDFRVALGVSYATS